MPEPATLTRASIVLIFAFSGIETALVPAREVRDPASNGPRALFTAMIASLCSHRAAARRAGVLGTRWPRPPRPSPTQRASCSPLGTHAAAAGLVLSTFGYLSGMALAVPRALYASRATDSCRGGSRRCIRPGRRLDRDRGAAPRTCRCRSPRFGALAILSNVAALLVSSPAPSPHSSCVAAACRRAASPSASPAPASCRSRVPGDHACSLRSRQTKGGHRDPDRRRHRAVSSCSAGRRAQVSAPSVPASSRPHPIPRNASRARRSPPTHVEDLAPRALVPFAHVVTWAARWRFYETLALPWAGTGGEGGTLDWLILEARGRPISCGRHRTRVAEEQAVLSTCTTKMCPPPTKPSSPPESMSADHSRSIHHAGNFGYGSRLLLPSKSPTPRRNVTADTSDVGRSRVTLTWEVNVTAERRQTCELDVNVGRASRLLTPG